MNGFLIRVLISSVLLLGHSVTASENNAMSLIKQLPSGGTDWRPQKGQVTRCGIFRRFMKRDWLSGEIVHMRQS